MIVYPAIDLKAGRCVRLVRGIMESATVFNDDPAMQARCFSQAGAQWLHVVDLDGAFAGKPKNAAVIQAIVRATELKVQLGGGIRDEHIIENWFERDVARIVLGTTAVKNPTLVREACRRWPGRIALGIDARGGKVAIEGWAETSAIGVLELARRFEDAGAAAIIYTDIDRDGALMGVNVTATAALARALKTPVIASGGVSSLDDLAALRAHETDGVAGAIVGRALYDGRVDLKSALELAAA